MNTSQLGQEADFVKSSKKYFAFLFLGTLIAISVEQSGWWQLIVSNPGKIHNDFSILISEDISTGKAGSTYSVLYTTDVNQANLVLNIWKILLVISVIVTIILFIRKW